MSNARKPFPLTQARPSRRVRHVVARSAALGLSLSTAAVGLIVPIASSAHAATLPSQCAQTAGTVTCNYLPTGAEQQFDVPAGVTDLQVAAVGGAGADLAYQLGMTYGGLGAVVTAGLPVTPGQSLYVEVGGQGNGTAGGFNGGGNGINDGQGGGGASDVRTCSMTADSCLFGVGTLDSRLLVAAGGGGAGGGGDALGGDGGHAGASPQPGAPGENSPSTFGGGGAARPAPTAGGTGGAGAADLRGAPGYDGTSGVQGIGGDGAHDANAGAQFPLGRTGGGGGGGGWFGGGGAGSGSDALIFLPHFSRQVPGAGGGGGAGSSYVDPSAANASITTAASRGAGSVTITYTVPVPVLPGAPSAGVAIPGDASAAISFTAPTFDGYSPITGYLATATPTNGGTPVTMTVAQAEPFTMTGLTNRTTYTVAFAAINSIGTGPSSPSSKPFTPLAPLQITTAAQLPTLPINKPLSVALKATGGTGVFIWSLLSGAQLPPGLTLSTDGVISGTPTTASTNATFSVEVIDGSGEAAIESMCFILVGPGMQAGVTGTPSTASVGEAYHYAFARTGNPSPYITKSSGSLPGRADPGLRRCAVRYAHPRRHVHVRPVRKQRGLTNGQPARHPRRASAADAVRRRRLGDRGQQRVEGHDVHGAAQPGQLCCQ